MEASRSHTGREYLWRRPGFTRGDTTCSGVQVAYLYIILVQASMSHTGEGQLLTDAFDAVNIIYNTLTNQCDKT